MNLTHFSLAEAVNLIQQRQLSPVDLTLACLEQIAARNPQINAFITLHAEQALAQARLAEARLNAAGEKGFPPLLGIPIGVKDLFLTADMPTTAGSRFPFPPGGMRSEDALVVQKLRAAGAIVLGKLAMHEIALGVTSENPHFGDCCNPWNPAHITGGSSGGSAAALAAGMVFGALGTDTGGSIRIPAALCGVVGLKPTRGRVSLNGVIPLSWSLDHVGPMARTVLDIAALLRLIDGYDALDPASIKAPRKDYLKTLNGGVNGWRIAVASDDYFTDPEVVAPEVLSAVQTAGRVFEALGALVAWIPFPGARQAALANGQITQAEAAVYHQARLSAQPDLFGADVRQRLQTGAALPLADYIQARRDQDALRRQFERFFEGYDILLTPTTPITAPQRGSADAVARARLLTRFTAPFNLTGLPAISMPGSISPGGISPHGLPIGLQLIAPPWAEARLLQAAYAYERATQNSHPSIAKERS